jgi:hypothetical protein
MGWKGQRGSTDSAEGGLGELSKTFNEEDKK